MNIVDALNSAACYLTKVPGYALFADVIYTVVCRIPSASEQAIRRAISIALLLLVLFPVAEHLVLLAVCETSDLLPQELVNYCCSWGKLFSAGAVALGGAIGASGLRTIVDTLQVLVVAAMVFYLSCAVFLGTDKRSVYIAANSSGIVLLYTLFYCAWSIVVHGARSSKEVMWAVYTDMADFIILLWPLWSIMFFLFVLPFGVLEFYITIINELRNLWFGVLPVVAVTPPPQDAKSKTLVLVVHGGGFMAGTTQQAHSVLQHSYVDVKRLIENLGFDCELVAYPLRKMPIGLVLILFAVLVASAAAFTITFNCVFGHYYGWLVLSIGLYVSGMLLALKHTFAEIYCDKNALRQVTYTQQVEAVQTNICTAIKAHPDAAGVILFGHEVGAMLALNAYIRGMCITREQETFARIKVVALHSGVYEWHKEPGLAYVNHFGTAQNSGIYTAAKTLWASERGSRCARLIVTAATKDYTITKTESETLAKAVPGATYTVLEKALPNCSAQLFTYLFWTSVFDFIIRSQ